MINPKVSVVTSGRRPQLWEDVHKSLSDNNKSSFEMIYAGPNKPDFELPPNMKFIHTMAKPAQCVEMAFRKSCGDYIVPAADDLMFAPGYIDKLCEYISLHNMESTVVIPHLSLLRKKRWQVKQLCKHHGGNAKWPVVGMTAFMKRTVWESLGGIDKEFTAIYWNNDLMLRFYERGGQYVMADSHVCVACERKVQNDSAPRLCNSKKGFDDWEVIKRLWHLHGKFESIRTRPVDSYSDAEMIEDIVVE